MIWIIIALLLLLPLVSIFGVFAWHHSRTKGLAYFGRTQAERLRFKKQVQAAGRWLRPVMRLLARGASDPNQFTNPRDGLYFPANVCSKASLDFAFGYKPAANDIFVVTQMKCGTTWMQQIVYEILMKGEGDFSDNGHRHLFATSPWLESFCGVSTTDAPLLGEKKKRLIKTHLPARACPLSDETKYIYVMRHPASCFASSLDFFRANAGDFTPPEDAMLDWFCSDGMWWGSWPAHAAGFYELSRKRSNVLFLTFEEMKEDLPGVVERVAKFLDLSLSDSEKAAVVEKSSFAYMKEHEEQFEMLPPGLFATGDSYFPSGSAKRFRSLSTEANQRIADYVTAGLRESDFPLADFYPDL